MICLLGQTSGMHIFGYLTKNNRLDKWKPHYTQNWSLPTQIAQVAQMFPLFVPQKLQLSKKHYF